MSEQMLVAGETPRVSRTCSALLGGDYVEKAGRLSRLLRHAWHRSTIRVKHFDRKLRANPVQKTGLCIFQFSRRVSCVFTSCSPGGEPGLLIRQGLESSVAFGGVRNVSALNVAFDMMWRGRVVHVTCLAPHHRLATQRTTKKTICRRETLRSKDPPQQYLAAAGHRTKSQELGIVKPSPGHPIFIMATAAPPKPK